MYAYTYLIYLSYHFVTMNSQKYFLSVNKENTTLSYT